MEALKARIAADAHARALGIELLEMRPGFARVAMTVKEDMLNFQGMAHGGVVFTLADAAFGAASNSHGRAAVALNVSISFLKAVQCGARLVATGQEENLTRRTGLYRLAVEDEEGNLVALAEGLVYRKDQELA